MPTRDSKTQDRKTGRALERIAKALETIALAATAYTADREAAGRQAEQKARLAMIDFLPSDRLGARVAVRKEAERLGRTTDAVSAQTMKVDMPEFEITLPDA